MSFQYDTEAYAEHHKDVYGYIPQPLPEFATLEEYVAEIERMNDAVRREISYENALKDDCWNDFLADVDKVAETLGGNKARAAYLLIEQEDEHGDALRDLEYFCFLRGLDYGKASELAEMIKAG